MSQLSSVVIDASATLPWLFADKVTPASERLAEFVSAHGAVVPAVWASEVANALGVAARRARILPADIARLSEALIRFPITIEPARLSQSLREVLPLAQRHRLTVYDASYLELALSRGLPLATNDAALRAAALEAGVAIWGA